MNDVMEGHVIVSWLLPPLGALLVLLVLLDVFLTSKSRPTRRRKTAGVAATSPL